jgi:putative ABC transport system substrate-binding protein
VKRRDFISLLGGAAAWPIAARAQQVAVPVVGYLNSASPEGYADRVRAFRQGLREIDYVEGQNVAIEYHWANAKYDRLPAMAADLVDRHVAVIVANGVAAVASQAASKTIPIVFTVAVNPVEVGLVASLNRPGGNLTGVTTLGAEIGPKRLELLHELMPTATIVGVLVNPTNSLAEALSRDLQAAARILGLQLHILHATTERDFETAFAALAQLRASGFIVTPDTLFSSRGEQLGALALRHAVPTVFQHREFAVAGGLMSYGGSTTDAHRLMGIYTGRILKGEKPAYLPIQQATRVELIINMKTAKALGLTVPLTLLGRADEVIE